MIEEMDASLTLQQFVENALSSGLDSVLEMVDHDMELMTEMEEEKVVHVLQLALSCTRFTAEDRPDMNEVLSSLLKLWKD
ncbi:putative LRR receptor-like serine/threonine-protein kinase FLS2 [Cocos nucifera]|uniref:Putative LRR receptor-like serine/threonine-protein kinase FLS2 n=1 Tax=Cocos nucifera TaxID=13894 RepID=A0A8K0I192_COCNU|nr:putative LRR receptor-like serine/threonine-protein kinase FLS2 [Cocos nucifera]